MATADDEWKDVPPTLYHYCNAEVLRGIVENKCLWMSSVASMNDYMEHNWFIEVARGCPILRRSVLDAPEQLDEFYERLRERLFSPPLATHYVVGFSTKADLLSQWRAYAGDGLGFAVGFDPKLFGIRPCLPSPRPTADNPDIGLSQVQYQGEELLQAIGTFITERHDEASPLSLSEAADRCYDEILQFALTSKNPAFEEEHEWRITWLPAGTNSREELCGPKFRTRNGRVIPYYELRCKLTLNEVMPIKEIVLGPKNPHRADVEAVRLLLATHDHDVTGIKFTHSQATYR